MSKYNNIEELFKSELGQLEADPGSGMWNAIQSKLVAQQAATTGSAIATGTGYSMVKVIVITAVVSISTGLGLGYLYSEKQVEKKKDLVQNLVEENTITPEKEKGEIRSNSEKEENTKPVVEESTIIYTQSDNKSTRVKVKVKEKEYSSSIVNSWLTPSDKKDKLMSQSNTGTETQNNVITDKNDLKIVRPVLNDKVSIVIENVEEADAPLAGIRADKSGGSAPLRVNFTNLGSATSYEWNFGDGTVSTDSNPQHIFEQAGTYTVSLTVKNAQGKKSTDQTTIVVKPESAFSINKKVNVISPNGDNINDHLSGDELKMEMVRIKDFQIVIFDLQGNLLFQSSDIHFVWDGTDLRGNKLPVGVYFYVIKAYGENGSEFKETQQITISAK